jgi:hypothetical protein
MAECGRSMQGDSNSFVTPANAGVQTCVARASRREAWIPAFAGMTYFYDDLFLSSAVAEQSRCSPRDMQEMLRAEKSPAQHRPSLECLV